MNESCRWLPMGAGGVCGIIATLLLSTSFLAHVACSQQDGLSKSQAKALIAEAQELEKQNKLQEAYYRYKNVETSYEVNDELRSAAWKDVQRIRLRVANQQKEIEAALGRYFSERGVYPESLSAISGHLTDSTRAAVAGFRYTKLSDTEFKLEDGIIG